MYIMHTYIPCSEVYRAVCGGGVEGWGGWGEDRNGMLSVGDIDGDSGDIC